MGFIQGGGSGKYIKALQGKILMPNPQGEFKYTDKNGKEHTYDAYKGIRCALTGIDTVDGKFGIAYEVHLVSVPEGEAYTLSIKRGSFMAQGLINALANCPVEMFEDFALMAWMKKGDEKERTSLFVNKPGSRDSIEWKVPFKELPDCPKMLDQRGKPMKKDGKDILDTSERDALFDSMVAEINALLGYEANNELATADEPF